MKHNYSSSLRRALSAVVLLLVSTLSWAYDFETGGIYYNINDDGTSVTVTSNPEKYSGDIVIPSTVVNDGKTYSVTSIGNNPFSCCSSLASVTVSTDNPVYDSREGCNAIIETQTNTLIAGCQNTVIPSSVTSIGNLAFYGCFSLTSINIPDGVTGIGDNAFNACTSLTSIDIPEGVTRIGDWAFAGCSPLTSIDIPSSVMYIGNNPFMDCLSLASITVAAGNPVYDSREGCNAIIETQTNTLIAGCQNTVIPSSVTSIGNLAFYGCSSLTSIDIPEGVTGIGDQAFNGCTSLTSVIVSADNPVYDSREGCNAIIETQTNTLIAGCQNTVIPSSVTSIGNFAFKGCYSLTSIDLPESVTSIGDYAFCTCTSLTSIDIPSSVTSIGDGAFEGCSSLTSIDLPESVTSIGDWAFLGCSTITNVICRAEKVPYASDAFTYTPIDKATLYVPASSINAYKAADGWKDFGTILSLEDYETGIDTPAALQPDEAAATAAPYYTLGGQRVNASVRGHIYIRSGRKVIY